MTIGYCLDIPLQDSNGSFRHGAAFLLRHPADQDWSTSLNGWTTTVRKGKGVVVTFGPSSATTFVATHSEALRAANNALDYMCMRGWVDLAIRLDFHDCLVWWVDLTHGQVVRARVINLSTSHISPVQVEVRDPSGEVRPSPPPPTPLQHDAFRFIRMARTAQNLFDSYRNMFLALEALLSDIRPRQMKPDGRPAETERAWLTAALTAADPLVPYKDLAPDGEPDPIGWFFDNTYGNERSALMHAKPGLTRLPQDDVGRAELRESLRVLWSYIHRLVGERLGVQFNSGQFSAYGWEYLTGQIFDHMRLFATVVELPGQEIQLSESEEDAIADHIVYPLTVSDRTTEQPMLISKMGVFDLDVLKDLPCVYELGAAMPNGAGGVTAFKSEVAGPLLLGDSVQRFELVAGVHNVNKSDLPIFSA